MRVCLLGLDAKAREGILLNLRLRWPDLETCTAELQQLHELVSVAPDLVLFNPTAPGGVETLIALRRSCDAAIVVVVPEATEPELVEMLEAGADDYLPLSASAPQLVARVSAALRRTQTADERSEPTLKCGDLRIDPLSHEVLVRGQVISLTPTEFKLLCHLARNRGRLVTHEALQALLWGSEGRYYADNLRKHVQRVREKIETRARGGVRIETVPRTGYRMRETLRDSS